MPRTWEPIRPTTAMHAPFGSAPWNGSEDDLIRSPLDVGRLAFEGLTPGHPTADQDAAIGEAIAELKADGEIDPQLIRGWALRAYRDLYRRCLEIGDFDGGRKVMKEITLLVGRQFLLSGVARWPLRSGRCP